jgi:hypothetical protein
MRQVAKIKVFICHHIGKYTLSRTSPLTSGGLSVEAFNTPKPLIPLKAPGACPGGFYFQYIKYSPGLSQVSVINFL